MGLLVLGFVSCKMGSTAVQVLGFGGRDRQAQESLLVFVQKILSGLLLLEIFLRGVEVGNKYSSGFSLFI